MNATIFFNQFHAVMASRIAGAFCIIAALKPLVDVLWNIHFSWRGREMNINTMVSALAFAMALASCTLMWRKRDRKSLVCLAGFAVIAFSFLTCSIRDSITMKYAASLAGLYLLSGGPGRMAGPTKRLMALSVAAVIVGCVLQMAGVLSFFSKDNLPLFRGLGAKWAEVGRLSSFYYHPLDLMRVLIWPFWHAVLSAVQARGAMNLGQVLLAIASLQFLIYRTTHRVSLVLSLLGASLLALRKPRRALALWLTIMAAWAGSALFFSWQTGLPLRSVLIVGHMLGVGYHPDYGKPGTQYVESVHEVKENRIDLNQGAKLIIRAQGRHIYWKQHVDWISTFSATELLFGARRPMPQDIEPEPHSQWLDFMERFGLVGTVLLTACLLWLFVQIPSDATARGIVLGTTLVYSIFTEILIMPTFVWWAALACAFLAAKAKARYIQRTKTSLVGAP